MDVCMDFALKFLFQREKKSFSNFRHLINNDFRSHFIDLKHWSSAINQKRSNLLIAKSRGKQNIKNISKSWQFGKAAYSISFDFLVFWQTRVSYLLIKNWTIFEEDWIYNPAKCLFFLAEWAIIADYYTMKSLWRRLMMQNWSFFTFTFDSLLIRLFFFPQFC